MAEAATGWLASWLVLVKGEKPDGFDA